MSQGSRFRNNNRRQQQKHKDGPEAASIDEQNPVLKAFQGYAQELDDKHDRYERIVKLSRDITIESKRIIFLLHTIDARKNNRAKTVDEAIHRLSKLIEVNFELLAMELIDQDPYQYRGAYSSGLQEFIEAYSFMEYFQCYSNDDASATMSDWQALQEKMVYQRAEDEAIVRSDDDAEKTVAILTEEGQPGENNKKPQTVRFNVDPTEYILGLSDLTGELMRRCINSLGSGETDVCLEACKVLQQFYTGYISLNVHRCRELSRKIYTMRQSVLKSENVCYNVKVRGGEAAKWGSVFDNKVNEDLDEGFY